MDPPNMGGCTADSAWSSFIPSVIPLAFEHLLSFERGGNYRCTPKCKPSFNCYTTEIYLRTFKATVCINAANIDFSRFSRVISQLRSVHRLYHQHPIYHPPDGGTGGISHGRILRFYGDRAVSPTKGGVSCQIRVMVGGDEN